MEEDGDILRSGWDGEDFGTIDSESMLKWRLALNVKCGKILWRRTSVDS